MGAPPLSREEVAALVKEHGSFRKAAVMSKVNASIRAPSTADLKSIDGGRTG